jgi:surface protein
MSNEVYQRLEYLDNGKAGNVISIGNYPGAISFCYVKYSFEQLPSTVPNALFGAFSGKGTKFRPRSTASKVAWYTYSSYGSEVQAFNHTTVAKSIYEGMWNVNRSWDFKKDGTRITGKDSIGYSIGSFQDVPIYVFGSNQNGSISESCRVRLYKLNLSIDSNSVYQLIPAKRMSDGVCGLFNEKSGKFYTALDNSTKYEFTGPGLNEYFDADMKSTRPATIEEKLENIEETKGLIKEAIVSKGVEVSDTDSFRSYAEKINNIQSGGSSDLKITDCEYLFYNGTRLSMIPQIFSLCKPASTRYLFYNCRQVTEIDLAGLDMSNVTDAYGMFLNCMALTTILNLDLSKVQSIHSIFSGCTNLNIPSDLNTSNVTNFYDAFRQMNTTSLPSIDTSKGEIFTRFCYGSRQLETVPELDLSSAIDVEIMFYQCAALVNLGGFKNLGKAYTVQESAYLDYTMELKHCVNLTHDSLMSVINKLYDLNLTYDVANGGTLYTQNLILGSENLAKLTAEEIAIATNKGWTVS